MRIRLILTALLLAGLASSAHGQWQQILPEQLPDNLGDIEADSVVAPTLRAYDAAGSLHTLYVGNNSGTTSEGYRLRHDSSSGVASLHVRNNLKFQFDSSLIYVRDPLDLTDPDDIRWNSDDGSFGYTASTNRFRWENSADTPRVEFDMDDGSIEADGRALLGDANSPLSLFVPAADCSLTTGAASLFPDADSWELTGSSPCVFVCPCPPRGEDTVLESASVVVFATDAVALNVSIRKSAAGSPWSVSHLVSFAGTDYEPEDFDELDPEGFGDYRVRTFGDAMSPLDTIEESEKVWAIVELEDDNGSPSTRFHGVTWKFQQVRY